MIRVSGNAGRSSSASPTVATQSAVAPPASAARETSFGAVPVAVRLDDGPELAPSEDVDEPPRVAANRRQVEREIRAAHTA